MECFRNILLKIGFLVFVFNTSANAQLMDSSTGGFLKGNAAHELHMNLRLAGVAEACSTRNCVIALSDIVLAGESNSPYGDGQVVFRLSYSQEEAGGGKTTRTTQGQYPLQIYNLLLSNQSLRYKIFHFNEHGEPEMTAIGITCTVANAMLSNEKDLCYIVYDSWVRKY